MNIWNKADGSQTTFNKIATPLIDIQTIGGGTRANRRFDRAFEAKKIAQGQASADAMAEMDYTINPETSNLLKANLQSSFDDYMMAKANAKFGLTDATKNLAIQENAKGVNTTIQNVNRLGGNASGFINGVVNATNNDFGLKLASADAEEQARKQGLILAYQNAKNNAASEYGGLTQNIQNLQTGRINDKKLMYQQTWGAAEAARKQREAERRNANTQAGASIAGSLISAGGTVAGAAI